MGVRAVVLVVFCLSTIAPLAYCQEVETLRVVILKAAGTVKQIDWVAGKIAISTDDYEGADEVAFIVPDDAQLDSGTEAIKLSDIEQGDWVEIQFVETADGPVVKRLVDTNTLNNEL